MSSDMHIATVTAKRKTQESEKEKKKNISILSAVSCLCLHAIYAVTDSEGFFSPSFLFVFSGLRWFFFLPGDVWGGQGQ